MFIPLILSLFVSQFCFRIYFGNERKYIYISFIHLFKTLYPKAMQPHYEFLRFFAIISSWFLIKDLIML